MTLPDEFLPETPTVIGGGADRERVASFIEERPEMKRDGEGRILIWAEHRQEWSQTGVVECPGCGELALFQAGRTPCCGGVDPEVVHR